MNKMKKNQHVLVTGGAGYLGSVLCEHLLDKGYQVTVVDNLIHKQASLFHLCHYPSFNFVFGDVRGELLMRDLIKRADAILPLAAIVGAPECDLHPKDAETTNYEAVKLLNTLRSKNQLVIFPTTNSGYGTKSKSRIYTEETPLEPISLYGKTKYNAEKLLLSSKNTICLRLASVFGMSPKMRLDSLVNHFVYKAITDGYIVIFEKGFKRNCVHIRDVADCFIHCLEHRDEMVGRTYNLGLDTANISKEELALEIKKFVPNFYIHFAEVGSDPDRRNYIISNQRLRETGFEAKRSLNLGIKELIKGYRMM